MIGKTLAHFQLTGPLGKGSMGEVDDTRFLVMELVEGRDLGSLSEDGQRVLTHEMPPVDPREIGVNLVQNWTRRLER